MRVHVRACEPLYINNSNNSNTYKESPATAGLRLLPLHFSNGNTNGNAPPSTSRRPTSTVLPQHGNTHLSHTGGPS